MSSNEQYLYDFEAFRLDPAEKVLLRDGMRVPLTPKVYDTLEIFVKEPGRLIAKSDLMERLWQDNFVEESNLTSNVKVLRKALGDDASKPSFIETVPRRGYRFVADVRTSARNNGSTNENVSAERLLSRKAASGYQSTFAIAAIFLLAVVVAMGFWFSGSASGVSSAPILDAKLSSEPFSSNGEVVYALITADARNVIYTNGPEGRQSIWLRQLETGNNIEVVPPTNDQYFGLAVSPDGDTIYFVRRPRSAERKSAYRVSVSGGVPTKIIDDIEGWLSLSPDGKKISFVRCPLLDSEYCSLISADAESGRNEKKLTSRPRPIRIADNDFSPGGRTIAFAVGQSQNQGNEFGLVEIDIESGIERELSPDKFFDIKNLAWLPGGSGLLVTAARIPNKHFRVWEVDTIARTTRTLTNDSESYGQASLPRNGELFVSTKVRQDFRLYTFPADDPAKRQAVADASHVAYAPDGKIYFSSPMSGNEEIWSVSRDGSSLRQMTNDTADDGVPTLSPKGDAVYFSSNRRGSSQVWRMNADGSDAKQITDANGGRPVSVTLDGKWVIYRHGLERNLWRVSADGGGEEKIFAKSPDEFAMSADGKFVAFFERKDDQKLLNIADIEIGETVKTFSIADQTQAFNRLAWMPDGTAIVYVLSPDGEMQTLWSQQINTASPQKIAELGTDRINSLAVSLDGKSFAIVQGGWKHDAVLFRGLK